MTLLVPSILADKYHNAENVIQADYLIKLKQENQTDVWAVVEAVIKLWREKEPSAWKSFIVSTEATRETRANKFGANKKEGLRYTVDMPEWVMAVLRQLYTPDELPMDKEFFKAFWRKYPIFRVSERS